MNAVLAQLEPARHEPETNVRTACEVLQRCGDADLVVFPELYLSGYDLDALDDLAFVPEGGVLDPLRHACALSETAAIVGCAEPLPGGGVANSAVCVDPTGEVEGIYRKTHLFGEERERFVAGSSLHPVPLGGLSVGVMICFDMEFPEVARTLASRGAEVLVTISANMEPFGPDHEVFCRARALENGLPHLYVNRVGEEFGFRFVGDTQAVDPEGRVLVRAGQGEQLVSARTDLASRSDPRTRYHEQLRAELYAGHAKGEMTEESMQSTVTGKE